MGEATRTEVPVLLERGNPLRLVSVEVRVTVCARTGMRLDVGIISCSVGIDLAGCMGLLIDNGGDLEGGCHGGMKGGGDQKSGEML